MRALAGLAVVLAACYHPNAVTGAPCAANGDCPDGQTCDTSRNPQVCVPIGGSGAPDGPPVSDASADAATTCTDDTSCAPSAPVCDPTTHTCRGCEADAECTGGVCHELAGTCIADAQVVFLAGAPLGDDTGTCTRARPCATFAHAFTLLSAARTVVRVGDGAYSEAVDLAMQAATGPIVLSGEDRDPAGATITTTASSPVMLFDLGTNVVLEGVTVENGANMGISARGTLVASRVLVSGNATIGISASGTTMDTLRVLDSRITGNGGQGVAVIQTSADLERVAVIGNTGLGVRTSQGAPTIVNCIVGHNGTSSFAGGGVRIDSPQGTVTIAHDTIAYNGGTSSTMNNAPGLQTNASFTVTNMIFADNGTATSTQYSLTVTPTHSLFEGGGTVPQGMGNRSGSPAFVSVGGEDFHITAASAALDVAASSSVLVDIDGQSRPNGGGPDMGADEYYP